MRDRDLGAAFLPLAETAPEDVDAALDAVLDLADLAVEAFGLAGDFAAEDLLAAGFAALADEDLAAFAAFFSVAARPALAALAADDLPLAALEAVDFFEAVLFAGALAFAAADLAAGFFTALLAVLEAVVAAFVPDGFSVLPVCAEPAEVFVLLPVLVDFAAVAIVGPSTTICRRQK